MNKEKRIKLKVGDTLYGYDLLKGGTFRYVVRNVIDDKGCILYDIECRNCRDHEPCRLLVTQADNKEMFRYVAMLNDNPDYPQYFWHSDKEFYTTLEASKTPAYRKLLKRRKDTLESVLSKIKELENDIAKLKLFEQVIYKYKKCD